MVRGGPYDDLPDVRDGLTRLERIILYELSRAQAEAPGRGVKAALLYGRVCEQMSVSQQRFMQTLSRLTSGGGLPADTDVK